MTLPELCVGDGNMKVGSIRTFSLPSRLTCPGASSWCSKHCYAYRFERRRPNCRDAYSRNLVLTWHPDEFVEAMLQVIPKKLPQCRIHVSGDFYSVEYIEAWQRICGEYPHTLFWCYTRSWNVPDLLPALEKLRDLPNVQLFASTDPSMPLPPKGWRVAFIEEDPRASGLRCLEQYGRKPSCLECGYCFQQQRGDVIFKTH